MPIIYIKKTARHHGFLNLTHNYESHERADYYSLR